MIISIFTSCMIYYIPELILFSSPMPGETPAAMQTTTSGGRGTSDRGHFLLAVLLLLSILSATVTCFGDEQHCIERVAKSKADCQWRSLPAYRFPSLGLVNGWDSI